MVFPPPTSTAQVPSLREPIPFASYCLFQGVFSLAEITRMKPLLKARNWQIKRSLLEEVVNIFARRHATGGAVLIVVARPKCGIAQTHCIQSGGAALMIALQCRNIRS